MLKKNNINIQIKCEVGAYITECALEEDILYKCQINRSLNVKLNLMIGGGCTIGGNVSVALLT